MKETYWGYWLVVLGVFIVVILLLIQNVTSNNTFDSYTVRQITEASLIDAVDYGYYREHGELKINKEKFVESLWRRFADVASVRTEYKILVTGVYEAPPKVSVEINSSTETFVIASGSETFDMSSRVNAILELKDNEITSVTPSTQSSSETIPSTSKPTITSSTRVPDVDSIRGFVFVTKVSEYSDKKPGTINEYRIKQYYLDNPKEFIEKVINDYQNYFIITFNEDEKNEMRNNIKNAFPWSDK